MTDEELARIRTFSLRGHEADGTMHPGGSLAALQGLLAYVDELRAKLAAAGLAERKKLGARPPTSTGRSGESM